MPFECGENHRFCILMLETILVRKDRRSPAIRPVREPKRRMIARTQKRATARPRKTRAVWPSSRQAMPFECGENHRFCILMLETILVRKDRRSPAIRPVREPKRRMIARTQKRATARPRKTRAVWPSSRQAMPFECGENHRFCILMLETILVRKDRRSPAIRPVREPKRRMIARTQKRATARPRKTRAVWPSSRQAMPFECGENHRFCILMLETILVRKDRRSPAIRPVREPKRRMIARTQKRATARPRKTRAVWPSSRQAMPFECGENHRFCILMLETILVRKDRRSPAIRPVREPKRRMIARTQNALPRGLGKRGRCGHRPGRRCLLSAARITAFVSLCWKQFWFVKIDAAPQSDPCVNQSGE